MMVDITSIVISVISLVGSLLAAAFTGWFQFFSDQSNRRKESEKLVAKYRDPLLLAAQDLQARLYTIVQQPGLLTYINGSKGQREILFLHTSFLVGQYLSWMYILRRQAQFLCFFTDEDNKELAEILDKIRHLLSRDDLGAGGEPLLIWRGQQMAIGEIMTVKEDGELYSIGFAAFKQRWEQDGVFQGWFHAIVSSITDLVEAKDCQALDEVPDHRFRFLQHLLMDLILILDPKQIRWEESRSERCEIPLGIKCGCSSCSPRQVNDTQHENRSQRGKRTEGLRGMLKGKSSDCSA